MMVIQLMLVGTEVPVLVVSQMVTETKVERDARRASEVAIEATLRERESPGAPTGFMRSCKGCFRPLARDGTCRYGCA